MSTSKKLSEQAKNIQEAVEQFASQGLLDVLPGLEKHADLKIKELKLKIGKETSTDVRKGLEREKEKFVTCKKILDNDGVGSYPELSKLMVNSKTQLFLEYISTEMTFLGKLNCVPFDFFQGCILINQATDDATVEREFAILYTFWINPCRDRFKVLIKNSSAIKKLDMDRIIWTINPPREILLYRLKKLSRPIIYSVNKNSGQRYADKIDGPNGLITSAQTDLRGLKFTFVSADVLINNLKKQKELKNKLKDYNQSLPLVRAERTTTKKYLPGLLHDKGFFRHIKSEKNENQILFLREVEKIKEEVDEDKMWDEMQELMDEFVYPNSKYEINVSVYDRQPLDHILEWREKSKKHGPPTKTERHAHHQTLESTAQQAIFESLDEIVDRLDNLEEEKEKKNEKPKVCGGLCELLTCLDNL